MVIRLKSRNNDDADGSENVRYKNDLRPVIFYRVDLDQLYLLNGGHFSWG